jgi:hypothetical protein
MGQEDVKTVQCDTTAQTCTVDVPAPGFALVFLTDDAFTENKGAPSMTFPTTAQTKTHNTGERLTSFGESPARRARARTAATTRRRPRTAARRLRPSPSSASSSLLPLPHSSFVFSCR